MEFVTYRRRKELNETETDFYRAEITLNPQTKKILNFAVVQLYQPRDKVYQVKKHDCVHGHYHIHPYYLGLHAKTEYSNEPITLSLFEKSKKDILSNWMEYRTRFTQKGLDV